MSLAAAPREQRTLTLLATQLGSRQRALRDALRPYTLEGNFGQIFDADQDDVRPAPSGSMIEMGHLMAMGAAAVVCRRSSTSFTGSSSNSTGARRCSSSTRLGSFSATRSSRRRLQGWLKTLRKKNVYVVFATQEVADAAKQAGVLSTILSACHTKIFLPTTRP